MVEGNLAVVGRCRLACSNEGYLAGILGRDVVDFAGSGLLSAGRIFWVGRAVAALDE